MNLKFFKFIIIMYMYFIMSFMMSLIFLMSSLMFKFNNFFLLIEWNMFDIIHSSFIYLIFLDWICLIFISTIMFISSMIMLYSTIYMNNLLKRFSWLMISFIFSMIFTILSPNLFSIMLGWDFLGLTSFCLIMFYNNEMSYKAATITIIINRIGDICLIMSIYCLLIFDSWSSFLIINFFNPTYMLTFFMLMCSLTKSAQIPFSSWLPLAMAAPTPISALVHSSTLVTAGIYLLIRHKHLIIFFNFTNLILLFSSISMFIAGMNACFELDFKKIIALSTLSQISFMLMILALNEPNLTFFHLLTHAIFKSLLFMCAGSTIHNMNNSQDIRTYGNLTMSSPWIYLITSFSIMSLCGLFFLSGFYSKEIIIENMYMMNNGFTFLSISISCIMFTFIYSFRMIYYMTLKYINNSTSMLMFHNNLIMDISMILSSILTLMYGSFLKLIFFDKKNLIYIPFILKIMILSMIPLSILLVKIINNLKLKYTFLFNLWFMDSMTMKFHPPILKYAKLSFNASEKGWIEMYTKNIIFMMLINMFKNLNMKMTLPSLSIFIISLSLLL